MSSVGRLAKQPVLSANDEGFDTALGSVIVNIQLTILCVGNEFIPLIKCVEDSFTEFGFG